MLALSKGSVCSFRSSPSLIFFSFFFCLACFRFVKCWSQVMKFCDLSDFVLWFASISRSDIIRWWIWLSLVEFSFIFDCCWHLTLGDGRVFFPIVSSSALPTTPCWLHLCSCLSLCVRRFITTFLIIFPPDLLLEIILNFSLCSFLFAASRSLYPPQFGVSSLRYKPSDILWSVRNTTWALFF